MLEASKATRKTGSEVFENGGSSTLLEYWAWAHSDIAGNTERGKIAEYIVAMALKVHGHTRTEWDSYDILSDDNIKIEVKSSAYLQTWVQKSYSSISFGIRPTYAWNQSNNTYDQTKKRQADVYVFCVLICKDQNIMNPLDLNQWEFYVLNARKLDSMLPNQKTVGLASLQKIGAVKSSYSELYRTIHIEYAAEY